jgi:hypothetical protein
MAPVTHDTIPATVATISFAVGGYRQCQWRPRKPQAPQFYFIGHVGSGISSTSAISTTASPA